MEISWMDLIAWGVRLFLLVCILLFVRNIIRGMRGGR